MYFDGYGYHGTSFEQTYRCYPSSFIDKDNWPSMMFAMAGGVVLSLGNLSTHYAWAFVGLSVREVITASITVVIGTTSNYFLDNRINRAEILFPGVGCFLVVVFLASTVHSSNAADNKEKLEGFSSKEGCLGKALSLDCPYVSLLVFSFLYSH
ncbi:ureide permease 3-like [Humulus lupulus]|uniref:ureide permease 3-like n=1 Tax=Humulus lupulus TaxID=3486 RepID=UPI002B40BC28|nr:ureide permease 3-like [Humulus lupulus]